MTYGLDTSVVVRLLMSEPPALAAPTLSKPSRKRGVGFTHTDTLATRICLVNEPLCRWFTCVAAYPFVRRDSRTSVALCTPRPPNHMSISL